MAVKRSSVVLLGLCIMVLVAMQAVDQVAAQCVAERLVACEPAIQGAYPSSACCGAVEALGPQCLCTLYSQYSRGQNPAEIQRAENIVAACDHLRYGFKCA
ncbi:unnamed protein product [Sphagnum troendelagicum]|uniref:Bifunctional inhibitor/plant lipid transfer protein/seed storage helical domain-containing protein n=1 Tax=Sphagnum troendelagicum TaxID=128251 RepID=A0ABP0TSQ4_9BRYO